MAAPAEQQGGAPQQPPEVARAEQFLESLLGAELPGEGLTFASVVQQAAASFVTTTPERVRARLLRAIEVRAINCTLPFDEEKAGDEARLILALSQSYLLLDPTVDESGIPVEGEGSLAHAQAQAQHQFPPRVQMNAAEQKVKEKHKPQEEALKGTRGQQPRPSPRVGGA